MSRFELRLTAMSRLVGVKSPTVEKHLSEEFGRIVKVLEKGVEYDELLEALKMLAVLVPRFHMATLPMLANFAHSVLTRTLTEGGAVISGTKLRYRSPESLVREAIDVAAKVGYVHTEQTVDFLLELSAAVDKEVRAKAERTLRGLAKFDLDVFYGATPRGAEPQSRMVSHLARLDDDKLKTNANIILRILGIVLSPTIEGTSSSFQAITIRRSSVASDGGIAAMRADAIKLAKRIYQIETSIDHCQLVLQTMDSATRREWPVIDADTSAMFERDAITVLEFMRDLVAREALPVVQSIEHQAYWDYYHGASQSIKQKALEVRDAIDSHAEYQIYKQLIGFKGIFGDWEQLSRSDEAWEYGDTKRRRASRKYLDEINDASFERWRDRILEFSKTRSDDLAMFPVYYDFLESIGRERSRLALELVTSHEAVMAPFLIALMRGLWASMNSVEIEAIAKSWAADGRHLRTTAKSLYKMGAPRLDILAMIADQALVLADREALVEVMGVAASLYADGAVGAKPIFMQSLRELAKYDDARWIRIIWFSKDFRALVSTMGLGERNEMLASLVSLPELDYQTEAILYELAHHDIKVVLEFLVGRLKYGRILAKQKSEIDDSIMNRFEPIPYQLPKLSGLLASVPGALLLALRGDFGKEVCPIISYSGVRLVKAAFPSFGEPLEDLLLKYVGTGKEDDIEFVLAILSTYDGSPSILGVCKAIIKTVPERSHIWNEVAASIETTGVVAGEYGIAQAFERKRDEISGWKNDQDERVRAFAEWIIESLQYMIENEQQRACEGLALRKYRYGIGKNEG